MNLLDYLRDRPLYAYCSTCGRDFLLVHSGSVTFRRKKISDYAPDELLWHPCHFDRIFNKHSHPISIG